MYTLVEVILTNTNHVNVCFAEFPSVDEAVAVCLQTWHDTNENPKMFYVIAESNVVAAVLVGQKDSDNVCVMTLGESSLRGVWRVHKTEPVRVEKMRDLVALPVNCV